MNVFGKGVAYAIEQYVNNIIKEFGSVDNIQVYPDEKRISGTLNLVGEARPCSIVVQEYVIDSGADNSYIIIKKLETSKEWANIVFLKYFKEIRIPLPKQAALVAKMVM